MLKKPKIRIERPFLGLVASGRPATLRFRLNECRKGMIHLGIKSRADGPVKLSRVIVEFTDSSPEDAIEVRQTDPAAEPNKTVYLDLYSAPADICTHASDGAMPKNGLLPHRPKCPHFVGSAVLRFSRRYAMLLAAITAIAATGKRLFRLPAELLGRLRPAADRGLRAYAPQIVFAALVIVGIGIAVLLQYPRLNDAGAEKPRPAETIEMRCDGAIMTYDEGHTFLDGCIVMSGKKPKKVICPDPTVDKNGVLHGCKAVW